jgi:NACalpha-BTF3-like transcription factor
VNEPMERTDDPDANRRVVVMALRQLARLEAEGAEANAWMNSVMAVFNDECKERITEKDRLAALVEEITKEMLPEGSKHVDIPGIARVQFKTTDEYLRVADPKAFTEWARGSEEEGLLEFIPASYKPITAEAKKFAEKALAETGEVLPGMERVPAVTTMKIERR